MGGDFRELFVVIAESAATLIGLLFVAVTVVRGRSEEQSKEIGEFRAAASLLAFTNALVVSLYGLVPGNGFGYPAFIMGVVGIFFAAAGVRTTLAQPPDQQRRWHQLLLILGLLAVFGFQIVYGLRLINHPDARGALESQLPRQCLERAVQWAGFRVAAVRWIEAHRLPPDDSR